MVAGQPMIVKVPATDLPGEGGRSASLQREAEAADAVLSTRHLVMDGTRASSPHPDAPKPYP
jgi:hypothetical protein|tara:strand:+ start:13 stop:198 length:186 start_codon:yes stop_codon:yes gene_type:complete